MKRTLLPSLLVFLSLLAGAPRWANAQDYDPPSRVARLAYVSGFVTFQPAGTDDWIDAIVNRPLTNGDALWTDDNSRAALHIGSASLHLSSDSDFTVLNLTDDNAQFQLNAGTLRVRVKWLRDNENFEIDTPNLAFTILQPGIYKISVNDRGDATMIEDRRGQGEVTGEGAAYSLYPGQIGTFSGFDYLNANVDNLGGPDDFESWCEQRDHHEDVSVSARYVSNYAIGYDDLDDYGGWQPVPGYGMVWFPHSVVFGWAPYHYGHWAYVSPWGYTWVDDASWGFAPFHYGRWVVVNGAWGWIPCAPRPPSAPAYIAPVYAPALVAWVGGTHFGVGLSAGVAWFPLGPREVYMPSYPVSRNYVNNVNVSNTTVNTTVVNNYYTTVVVNKTVNVTNVTYVNQRVPGAVAATTQQAFTSGQPVARNVVHVDPHEVAAAPVNALTPPAVPQREAVLGGGHQGSNKKPPAAVQTRTVVAKVAPPPPPPAFAQRQAAIQSNGGHPISIQQARQIVQSHPQPQAAAAVRQLKVAPPAKPIAPVPAAKVQAAKPNPPPMPAPANSTSQHPPTAFAEDPKLEQKHQQQNQALQAQQDQQRKQLQAQQAAEAQKLQQQKVDEAKLQVLQQQHQQQLAALAQQHQREREQLQQKQTEEHLKAQPKPAPKDKDEKHQ